MQLGFRQSALLHSQPANTCVFVQDFADELDVMPSITLENNVIHNNEGYGVILVKPSSPQEACEGRSSQWSVAATCSVSIGTENPVKDQLIP